MTTHALAGVKLRMSPRIKAQEICLPAAVFNGESELVDCNNLFLTYFGHFPLTTRNDWINNFEHIVSTSTNEQDVFETTQRQLFRLHWSQFQDQDQSFTLLIAHNLSQTHQSLRKTQQLQNELLQTSKSLSVGEMATTLAHELNQPLGAIYNYLSAANRLIRPNEVNPRINSAIVNALHQAEYAASIIKRIREFVFRRQPIYETCDVRMLVEHVIQLLSPELVEHSIKVRVECSLNTVEARVDKVLIEQVFANLIRNSIDAMRNTSPNKRILEITFRTEDHRLKVSVTDCGCGVGELETDQIFDTFFTTKKDGMGIGLSICRTILEHHQGKLYLEPTKIEGTTFVVLLPLTP